MEYHAAGVIQGAFERMRSCVAVLPVFFVLVTIVFPLRAGDTLPDADAVKPPSPAADEVVLDPVPTVDKDKEEKRREERKKERKEERKKKQQKSGKGKCKV
ncbi:MAG TPA: hypothetical protein PKH10_11260 [bacterium]|nr:hypothetical protein [bacterium]